MHVDRFMVSKFVAAYNAIVMVPNFLTTMKTLVKQKPKPNISNTIILFILKVKGRRDHSKFNDLVAKILGDKEKEAAIKAAVSEAAKKASEASLFSRMLG